MSLKAYSAGAAKKPAVLFVKADWCPHCKTAKPELEAAAQQLTPAGISVIAMDSERDKAAISKLKNFKGFPSIYYRDERGKLTEYKEGERKAQKIVDWACAHSGKCGKSSRK